MKCYLCGRDNARVVVELQYSTLTVCRVCDQVGTFCVRCDRPIRSEEEKFFAETPWGDVNDGPSCGDCERGRVDHWLETVNEM